MHAPPHPHPHNPCVLFVWNGSTRPTPPVSHTHVSCVHKPDDLIFEAILRSYAIPRDFWSYTWSPDLIQLQDITNILHIIYSTFGLKWLFNGFFGLCRWIDIIYHTQVAALWRYGIDWNSIYSRSMRHPFGLEKTLRTLIDWFRHSIMASWYTQIIPLELVQC